MRSWNQKVWGLLLYTNLWSCFCLFTWDKILDFSQRVSLLNPGLGKGPVILPSWQMRLTELRQTHKCTHLVWLEHGLKALCLHTDPGLFPLSHMYRRVGRRPLEDRVLACRKPRRTWVRLRLELPSLCSGLPLEAESRFDTTLAFCCSWTLAQELKFMAAWCLDTDNGQQAELHFHVRSSMLQWWNHWPWYEFCTTKVTWPLWFQLLRKKQ